MSQIKERSVGLDLVRAIAILLVLLSHSGLLNFPYLPIGVIGVEVFFVLSGFLIGQILVRDFMNGVNYKGLFRFWIRRWLRTLPIYYLVILFKFIFIDSSVGSKIIFYFFFLQNNFGGVDFYRVSWSLVIEEWFYLLLPILFIFFFKNGISDKKNKFIFFLISIIIIINSARFAWVLYTDCGWGAIVGNFPFRLDSLLIGVLAAAAKILFPSFYKNVWQNNCSFVSGLLLFFILVSAFAYSGRYFKLDELLWVRTIWFSLLSFSFAIMLPYIDISFTIRSTVLTKCITWISLISYSLYLVHPLIYNYVSISINAVLNLFISNGMLFIVCSLSYLYIEKPIMNLREKIKICA